MRPGRKSTAPSPDRSTMVDSIPTALGPPSSTTSASAPRSARTCAAVVAESSPKRFAEGAAMAPPNARSNSRAPGCAGTRRPIVSWPPVTKSPAFFERLRTSVRGPGQNFAASLRAPSGTSRAHSKACFASAKCTITGWSAGRRFAA